MNNALNQNLFVVNLLIHYPTFEDVSGSEHDFDEESDDGQLPDCDFGPIAIVEAPSPREAISAAIMKLRESEEFPFDFTLILDKDHSELHSELFVEELDRDWFSRRGVIPTSSQGYQMYLTALGSG